MVDGQQPEAMRVVELDWGFDGVPQPGQPRRFHWKVTVPPATRWTRSELRRTIDAQLLDHELTLRHQQHDDLIPTRSRYRPDGGTDVSGDGVCVGLPPEMFTPQSPTVTP